MLSQHDILKKVRQVELRTRRAVTDALAGSYHSVFRGQGIDFEETREYQPGDDVRSIDWNVTARMDRPFVKVFREERELTLLLAVDVSASQVFGSGSRSKRETAAELAAILAMSAIRNNDKVGLLLFTDEVEVFIPPRKGRQHVLRVVRDILFHAPKGRGTKRGAALDYINHVLHRRAVVFLISDLSGQAPDDEGLAARTLAVTAGRHDLVVADLHDPREAELPDVGVLLVEDPETGRTVELDTGSRTVRRRFAQLAADARDGWRHLARRGGADYLPVSTGTEIVQALRGFMDQRGQRR